MKTFISLCIIIATAVCCYFGCSMIDSNYESESKDIIWFCISLVTMLGFILVGKVVL